MIKFADAQTVAAQLLIDPLIKVQYTHLRRDPALIRRQAILDFEYTAWLKCFMGKKKRKSFLAALELPSDAQFTHGMMLRPWYAGIGWSPDPKGGATRCEIFSCSKTNVLAAGLAVCHTCDTYVPDVGRELSLAYAQFALAKHVYRDLYNTSMEIDDDETLVAATIHVVPAHSPGRTV